MDTLSNGVLGCEFYHINIVIGRFGGYFEKKVQFFQKKVQKNLEVKKKVVPLQPV